MRLIEGQHFLDASVPQLKNCTEAPENYGDLYQFIGFQDSGLTYFQRLQCSFATSLVVDGISWESYDQTDVQITISFKLIKIYFTGSNFDLSKVLHTF